MPGKATKLCDTRYSEDVSVTPDNLGRRPQATLYCVYLGRRPQVTLCLVCIGHGLRVDKVLRNLVVYKRLIYD